MKSKASLDTLSKVITLGVFILFIAIGQKNMVTIAASEGDLKQILPPLGASVLLLLILICSYLFSTTSYSVTDTALIIHRPLKNKVINRADVLEVRRIGPEELKGTIRVFGVGGLFGYYGKFSNSKFGYMTWYVTQKENRILIRTRSGKILVISPDDPSFLSHLQSLKHQDR